ncbi:hypothetical protein ABID14_000795 [Peptoniphilus olsenii]|uniref:Uncharacterized protein n=1 Tax=Peptoniphilus olsenii TaxID=411570 RepID=A0ABV2J8T3_9FIRM
MGCFIVPATEAVVTTAIKKAVEKKEDGAKDIGIKFSTKLGWLNKLLWGGSALLAFEHIWHGEVVPFFPFLTAVSNGETKEMLKEMSSVGVLMAVIVTLVWILMVFISNSIENRQIDSSINKENASI